MNEACLELGEKCVLNKAEDDPNISKEEVIKLVKECCYELVGKPPCPEDRDLCEQIHDIPDDWLE